MPSEKYYVKRGKKGIYAYTECGNRIHKRTESDPKCLDGVLCPKFDLSK